MNVRGSVVLCDRCGARYPLASIPRDGRFRCRNCGKSFQLDLSEGAPEPSTGAVRRAAFRAGLEPLTESVRADPGTKDVAGVAPPASRPAPAPDEPAPPAPPPRSDDLLLGRYAIEGELGRGEMGVVYRAKERSTGLEVALKTLLPGVTVGRDDGLRFGREARAIQRLEHASIVPLLDHGESYDTRFLVSELALGTTLDRQAGSAYGDPRDAARLVSTLARALHHAHQHGVLHLDLKPRNVVIAPDGTPRLTDFGLSRAVHTPAEHGFQSPTDELGGQTLYRAPELLLGERDTLGAPADVWGLGALLYELLTGVPAFTGGTKRDTVREVLDEDPKPPSAIHPDISVELDLIVGRALEKRPADRYPSAAALAEDLDRFLTGMPIEARPPSVARRVLRTLRRRRATVRRVAVALAVAALAAGGAAWWLRDPMTAIREELRSVRAEDRAQAVARALELVQQGGMPPAHRTEVVDLSIAALTDSAEPVRRAALERLVRNPSLLPGDGGERRSRFETALIANLGERRTDEVRDAAFEAIELFRAHGTAAELARIANDPDTATALALRAARALGVVGGTESIAPLMRLVGRGGDYRVKAMEAISRIVERTTGDAGPAVAASERTGGIARGAASRGPDPVVNRVLAELQAPAGEDPILYTLQNGATDQRLRVVWLLYRTRDPRTPSLLGELFADDDPVVARAAAAVLVEFGGPLVELKLEEALGSPSSRVRGNAAFALGELKNPDAVDPLVKALFKEGDAATRAQIVEALGGIGQKRTAAHLIRALGDPDQTVRKAARASLGRLAGEDRGEAPAAWQEWWDTQ